MKYHPEPTKVELQVITLMRHTYQVKHQGKGDLLPGQKAGRAGLWVMAFVPLTQSPKVCSAIPNGGIYTISYLFGSTELVGWHSCHQHNRLRFVP